MGATEEHSIDQTTILGGRVKLLQSLAGFRAGLDAVFVAAAVPAKPGDHIADLGCAGGAAGFCVLARVENVQLTGMEIQPELAARAALNAALNGWEGRCRFINGDIRVKNLLPQDTFDHVLCNPPYLAAGAWSQSPDKGRAAALGAGAHEDAVLQDWVDCAQRIVKPGGSVTFIHRADHVDKLIQAFGTRFGGVQIWPLYPYAGEAANRVVIRALKNRKTPAIIHPGIILHEKGGAFSGAADGVLANALPLGGGD